MKTKIRITENKICPLEEAVNTISGKWKIPILWKMNEGIRRPSELLRGIAVVDRRVLNQQLREMESDGLIQKEVFPEVPPRVEYTLTPLGENLVQVLWSLNSWGETLIAHRESQYSI